MAKKIVALTGSYRRGGVIDLAVAAMAGAARERGAEVSVINLLDKQVEFCTNCRACTQGPGEARGVCVLQDDMAAILDQLEAADGLILAAPVNFFNVTAITRRFLERLAVYAYWPWGQLAPKFRIKTGKKKAVLVTSSAAPSLIGRLFFKGALKALKIAADAVGAKPVGSLYIGMACTNEKPVLTANDARLARKLGIALAEAE